MSDGTSVSDKTLTINLIDVTNERATGTNAAEKIIGSLGADVFKGMGGIDTLIGGVGNDLLDGGTGNDPSTGAWVQMPFMAAAATT